MKKKKQQQKKPETRKMHGVKSREIVGILLLGFSIFSILALYVDATGLVGLALRSLLRMAFGDLAILYSLVFFFASIYLFLGRKWSFDFLQLLGAFLLICAITLSFHMLYHRGYQLPPQLKEELAYGSRGEGGGIFGALLLVVSYAAFGIEGSYVIVSTMALLGIILFFKTSLLDLGGKFIGFIKRTLKNWWHKQVDAWEESKEKRKLARIERKAQQEPKESKETKKHKKKRTKLVKDRTKAKSKLKPEDKEEKDVVTREPALVDEVPKSTKSKVLKAASQVKEGEFALPPTYLLKKSTKQNKTAEENQQNLLEETFTSFGIEARVVNVEQGPVVTRYELQPAPGIKVSRITALADDLALSLAAADVRIEAPVPGKPVVGIEVPNKSTEAVLMRDVLESEEFSGHDSPVALVLGKDIAGRAVVADLKKWLHVLVAGATGSGKSVCLNAMIASILFKATPDEVKLLMIDPKRVELSVYDGIPHLISPVVTDPKKAAVALRWAVAEMERRYELFAETGARNIDMYKEFVQEEQAKPQTTVVDPDSATGEDAVQVEPLEDLPYIVIIVDELADLMMIAAAEVEDAICRLAQMARAAGMYLIIATQRPSVDVITGLIKANVPSRISFAVSSQVDSRTILDMGGAERLIGKGDMLYYPIGASKPTRAQGAWISDQEVELLVEFWKKQAQPEYEELAVDESEIFAFKEAEEEDDELLPDAIRLVVENGQASISMLQRRFRIGYARAARLIDVMEIRGIVGSYQGSKPRDVLVDSTILDER